MEKLIPKRIIQTGKSLPLSVRARATMANLRLLNPEFEYRFFDDAAIDEFINREFPQYRAIFDAFPHNIQRIDFFRYLAVYLYGGYYFDLDVLLASSLSEIPPCSAVFPFEGLTLSDYLRFDRGMDWEIGNFAFGATAGHPFLRAIIDNCVRGQQDPEWLAAMMRGVPLLCSESYSVLFSTGPGLISRTLAENPDLAPSVHVLFPSDVCDLRNWNCFGDFGVHLMEGSWRRGSWLFRRVSGQFEVSRLHRMVERSRKRGPLRFYPPASAARPPATPPVPGAARPLVSILIPAYNASRTIAETLHSALAQTWEPKEIIVVDDGSTDATPAILKEFESRGVRSVRQENQGAAVARNLAFSLCKGDFIQWLDADDLLAPDKIERQLAACDWTTEKRILLSGEWGQFLYRTTRAKFKPTPLWASLTPAEWLLRKLGGNFFMTDHAWLVSRELTEAAGPWDVRLVPNDDDGEYFCRVLMASEGTRHVPGARVFYRSPGLAFAGLSHIGHSEPKGSAYWLSTALHIKYLRALDDSPRSRSACLTHLQFSLCYFFPEWPDLVQKARKMAEELGGALQTPRLSWKYAWIEFLFGEQYAKRSQHRLLRLRWSLHRRWDKLLFILSRRNALGTE